MLFDTSISGAEVGLAITQAMSLTGMMQWGEFDSIRFAFGGQNHILDQISFKISDFQVFVKALKSVIN